MKKDKTPTISIFYLHLFVCVFVGVIACKKNATQKHSPFDSKFSFSYNGNKYILPFKEGNSEWTATNGIYINRPDIFNGTIHYPYTNCAYFAPQANGLYVQVNTNCQLSVSGFPIDSLMVYLYQSGSYNITYRNCYKKKEYDIFTSSTILYDVCDADGTFNLTLKNKENKTITITDGTFQVYSFRR